MTEPQSGKNNFPSISQSEKAKDRSYYRSWADAIVTNQFTNSWSVSYNKLAMLYNFFKEGTGSDLTGYLQTAPDGAAMPGIWTSQNSVSTRLKALVGELEHRGYEIEVTALNPEAKVRKKDERARLLVERKLQKVSKAAERMTGMPLQSNEYVPQTDQELDEHLALNWKDIHVEIIRSALKWIAERNFWDQTRVELFLDQLIGNMCVVRNDVVRCVPKSTRVDLLKFIYDPHASDDNLTDSTYFGEADYMPLAAAAERYGLSMKEMTECYQEYKQYLGMGLEARSEAESHKYFGGIQGQSVKWFKDDGIPRCLVVRACWRDIKILAHKEESNEKGEFLQDVTYDDKEQSRKRNEGKIIKNKIECWRQATIIGGKFLREWGECPNQPRKLDSLEISEPPYKVWRQTKTVSMVEQLVGLQLLKDIALYQLQIQMARAVGKVLVFDEAMLAEGMDKTATLARMKADGIAWINSKEYQLGGNMNLFKEYDLSLSASIAQSIQLISYFDSQIDGISGVSPERQGQVQGASQAVGVTQAALFQSSLITAPLFRGFDRFCSRIQNHLAKLVKLTWSDGHEKYAEIIGDAGVNFLQEFVDISLDEFDIKVSCAPPILQDRAKLEQIIMIAVQTGELLPSDALNILLERDVRVAVRKYTRKVALRQMEAAKQEQQQMMMEQQAQQDQAAHNAEMLAFNRENAPSEIQRMKEEAGLKKTALTGRVKLQAQKMDLLNS